MQSALAAVAPGFRPRLPGLTKLMSRYSRSNEWQKAIAIFDSLPLLRLAPDTTITNAAIAACDKGGAWRKAYMIFLEMDCQGLLQDTITFSSAISALSKSKQAQLSVDVRSCANSTARASMLRALCCSVAAWTRMRVCGYERGRLARMLHVAYSFARLCGR